MRIRTACRSSTSPRPNGEGASEFYGIHSADAAAALASVSCQRPCGRCFHTAAPCSIAGCMAGFGAALAGCVCVHALHGNTVWLLASHWSAVGLLLFQSQHAIVLMMLQVCGVRTWATRCCFKTLTLATWMLSQVCGCAPGQPDADDQLAGRQLHHARQLLPRAAAAGALSCIAALCCCSLRAGTELWSSGRCVTFNDMSINVRLDGVAPGFKLRPMRRQHFHKPRIGRPRTGLQEL